MCNRDHRPYTGAIVPGMCVRYRPGNDRFEEMYVVTGFDMPENGPTSIHVKGFEKEGWMTEEEFRTDCCDEPIYIPKVWGEQYLPAIIPDGPKPSPESAPPNTTMEVFTLSSEAVETLQTTLINIMGYSSYLRLPTGIKQNINHLLKLIRESKQDEQVSEQKATVTGPGYEAVREPNQLAWTLALCIRLPDGKACEEFSKDFEAYMTKKYPDWQWAYDTEGPGGTGDSVANIVQGYGLFPPRLRPDTEWSLLLLDEWKSFYEWLNLQGMNNLPDLGALRDRLERLSHFFVNPSFLETIGRIAIQLHAVATGESEQQLARELAAIVGTNLPEKPTVVSKHDGREGPTSEPIGTGGPYDMSKTKTTGDVKFGDEKCKAGADEVSKEVEYQGIQLMEEKTSGRSRTVVQVMRDTEKQAQRIARRIHDGDSKTCPACQEVRNRQLELTHEAVDGVARLMERCGAKSVLEIADMVSKALQRGSETAKRVHIHEKPYKNPTFGELKDGKPWLQWRTLLYGAQVCTWGLFTAVIESDTKPEWRLRASGPNLDHSSSPYESLDHAQEAFWEICMRAVAKDGGTVFWKELVKDQSWVGYSGDYTATIDRVERPDGWTMRVMGFEKPFSETYQYLDRAKEQFEDAMRQQRSTPGKSSS